LQGILAVIKVRFSRCSRCRQGAWDYLWDYLWDSRCSCCCKGLSLSPGIVALDTARGIICGILAVLAVVGIVAVALVWAREILAVGRDGR
jgi:hypothetical protein